MDKLDMSILRALRSNPAGNPYASKLSALRELASEVGVSKDTVKARLDSLTKRGVFGGWQVMLNPSLLSLQLARIWLGFSGETAKKEAMERLKTQRWVQRFTDYYGSSLSYVTAFDSTSSLKDQIDLGKSLFSARTSFGATLMFPDCTLTEGLKEVAHRDVAIYKAIWEHYDRPIAHLSEESGLSVRSLSRRLAKLAESNAIFVIPMINPFAIDGAVCQILVRHSKIQFQQIVDALATEGNDCVLFSEPHSKRITLVVIAARNITRGQEMMYFLRKMPGVDSAKLFLVLGAWKPPRPYLSPFVTDLFGKNQDPQSVHEVR